MPRSGALRARPLDFEKLASDWLRAARGKRSQSAHSRRLGYKTNIAYRWEAGHCFPTAARAFEVLARSGADIEAAFGSFVHLERGWSRPHGAGSRQGIARFLQIIKGGSTTTALAERSGSSRYCVARWLSGASELTLPRLLSLIEAMTGRALDFIACFVSPAELPSARLAWRLLEESRELAYRLPWSHAVLRALALNEYASLPRHDARWIAARIGAPVAEIEESLAALERVGHVYYRGAHYRETAPDTVNTRADPARDRDLKAWWAERALERLSRGSPGLFAFNLSAVSRGDLERLQQIQRRAYREMSQIISDSEHAECVVLHSASLLALDADG